MEISQQQAADLIRRSKGKLFSVRFFKRTDHTERLMVARIGVSKGVQGVGLSYDPADHGLLTVSEFVAPIRDNRGRFIGIGSQFCSIPIEGIKELRIGGMSYTVV